MALLAGLALGTAVGGEPSGLRGSALGVAGFVGTLWLNALKMTVIPLVVALLVVGIAKGREAAAGGRIAGRSVLWIVIICTASAMFGAVMILVLTRIFPLPRETALGLQAALAGAGQKSTAPLPGIADFFKGIIPDNVFAAAANGDVLPLVVFSILFALALGSISATGRRAVVTLFQAIADALVVIIEWVLWIAPLGVFALGLCRRFGGGRLGLRRARPLCRPDLADRGPGDACRLSAGDHRRARQPGGVHPRDDRAAGGRDLDPVVARLAAGDADRGADHGRPR